MNSIVKVSCGGYFSVVLLSDHRVFSVGENSFAECGFSNNEARIGYYRHVKEADECNVVDINCGYHFTVFTGGTSA
jgi:alpha-tubulin suppressor-like RCC1 family protein